MPKKKQKHQGHENPALFRSIVERAQSGASGTHADKRTKRARTRDAAKRRALGDQALIQRTS